MLTPWRFGGWGLCNSKFCPVQRSNVFLNFYATTKGSYKKNYEKTDNGTPEKSNHVPRRPQSRRVFNSLGGDEQKQTDTIKKILTTSKPSQALRDIRALEQSLKQQSSAKKLRWDETKKLKRKMKVESKIKDAKTLQFIKDKQATVLTVGAKKRKLRSIKEWAQKEHPTIWERIVSKVTLRDLLQGKNWDPSVLLVSYPPWRDFNTTI